MKICGLKGEKGVKRKSLEATSVLKDDSFSEKKPKIHSESVNTEESLLEKTNETETAGETNRNDEKVQQTTGNDSEMPNDLLTSILRHLHQ